MQQKGDQQPEPMSRREFNYRFFRLFLALSVMTDLACGGERGTKTTTVQAATLALGLHPVIDEEISTEMGSPFVVALKNPQGQVVMEGQLVFTVNGNQFHDGPGPNGDKSILSTILTSDVVAWHRL